MCTNNVITQLCYIICVKMNKLYNFKKVVNILNLIIIKIKIKYMT